MQLFVESSLFNLKAFIVTLFCCFSFMHSSSFSLSDSVIDNNCFIDMLGFLSVWFVIHVLVCLFCCGFNLLYKYACHRDVKPQNLLVCKLLFLFIYCALFNICICRQRNSLIQKAIPHCLMWCLWRERNLRSFEDLEMSSPALKLLFFQTLIEWLNATGCYSFSSPHDFLNSCSSLDH